MASAVEARDKASYAREIATWDPSCPLQQRIEFARGALAEIVAMGRKELVGRCTAAIAQHGQKSPFGVELGRIAEVQHDVAGNAVNPHAGPARTLVVHRVR